MAVAGVGRRPHRPPVPDWWSLRSRFSYASFDDPPRSRLFLVLAQKKMTPEVWHRLSSFGAIEDFWPQVDKRSLEPTGAVFVKFARSSDACRALEEMRSLGGGAMEPGVVKICLAQSRASEKSGNLNLELHAQIHAKVPNRFTEETVRNVFKVYGDIVSCAIVRNEDLGKCEVLACIKFSKASQAALAIEECDKSYHAIWADVGTDLPESSEHSIPTGTDKSSSLKTPVTNLTVSTGVKSPVSRPEQETAICELQEESLNTSDKSSSLKTPVTNLTVSTGVKSAVSRPEQEKGIFEVQGESLNTSDESSSLKMPVTNLTVSTGVKSPVNRPEQKTANCEVQGKSLNTLGKSTSLDKIVTESSKFSVPKSHVNSRKHNTTDHEVQENTLNPLDEHISLDEPMMKPSVPLEQKAVVVSAETETTSCEVKEGSLIPVVCTATSIESVTKTSESDTHKSCVNEQRRKIHRIQGSNLIVIGSVSQKTKAKLSDALKDKSYMNRAEQNTNTVRERNLITLGDTTLSKTAAKSFEGSVKRCKQDIAGSSNVLTLGCNTAEVEPVFTPPEHYGYGYYVGSTGYSSTLPVSLTEPLASNLHYYNASSVEQQTDTQRIQENSFITPDKSLKSSELKFYMGGRKTRSRNVHGNNLLASVGPPDLASVERSNSKRQASISRRLLVVSKFPLTQELILSLFGVIPGLECCETPPCLHNNHVFAIIRYKNIASAVYAKCRLHGLEYPLGNKLHVSFVESETHGSSSSLIQEMATQVVTSQLVSVIWNNNWAPQLLASSKSWIPSPSLQTNAELPSRKRKAPPDSAVREKLFIVFDPCPLPQDVLDNVLSRFGNFINSHHIPGENVAYAKFAERESASHAIAMLHGKTVNGVKLKVILADLPTGL